MVIHHGRDGTTVGNGDDDGHGLVEVHIPRVPPPRDRLVPATAIDIPIWTRQFPQAGWHSGGYESPYPRPPSYLVEFVSDEGSSIVIAQDGTSLRKKYRLPSRDEDQHIWCRWILWAMYPTLNAMPIVHIIFQYFDS